MSKRLPYRPIKITAHMAAPIAGELPMLDALLEYVLSFHMSSIAKTDKSGRHKHSRRSRGGNVEHVGSVPIAIKRDMVGGLPIPRCSSPIASSSLLDYHDNFTRALRDGLDTLAPKARIKLNTTGGAWKSYRLPLRVRSIDRLVWFAYGYPGHVRKHCRKVTHLGKKTAIGYGRVAKWEVEDCEEDLSWFAESESGKVLMRPLPVYDDMPEVIGSQPWFGSPCPPYWQRSLYREIVRPC